MNFFEKKRVLVLGPSLSDAGIARIIAEQHPDITVDLMTSNQQTSNIPNLNVIPFMLQFAGPVDATFWENKLTFFKEGSFKYLTSDLLNFIKEKNEDYDLIIALGLEFQRWMSWRNLRKSIKTPILCPSHQAANTEFDKLFTKDILLEIGIPTPKYDLVDPMTVIDELDNRTLPIVFKFSKNFSALGFGSWVFKKRTYYEIVPLLLQMTSFVEQEIYTEEFIKGKEVSVHFICNGTEWQYIGAARDYKKAYEYDLGANTSGTGSYSEVDYFTDEIKSTVFEYMDKLMLQLNRLGIFFKGIFYMGIMIDENNIPYILEINSRPGLPEMLSILGNVKSGMLLENFYRAATEDNLLPFEQDSSASVSICIVHKNYNHIMKLNSKLPDFSDAPNDIKVDYASYMLNKYNVYCCLTATGNTRFLAAEKINKYLETKDLKDFRFRKDIGFLE
jgi:phosphoribosylamine---glycine ligase